MCQFEIVCILLYPHTTRASVVNGLRYPQEICFLETNLINHEKYSDISSMVCDWRLITLLLATTISEQVQQGPVFSRGKTEAYSLSHTATRHWHNPSSSFIKKTSDEWNMVLFVYSLFFSSKMHTKHNWSWLASLWHQKVTVRVYQRGAVSTTESCGAN